MNRLPLGALAVLLAASLLAAARDAAPAAGPRAALQAPGGEGWTANASTFRGRNGERFVFTCPKYGAAGSVWGTDVYTDDSSVCTAGVHAGRIDLAGGGTVTIEIRPGQASYTGSTRNRIVSANYPAWGGSFVIVGATRVDPGVGAGGSDWRANANAFRAYVGSRFAYTCPTNGTAGAIWGTDVYTDDTSVCTAAVHAGRITLAGGGRVTIEMRDGRSSYTGSNRNGIRSSNYAAWPGSFVIVAATGGGPPPGAPPAGTATGTVLVNGQPFTSGTVPFGSTVDVSRGRLTLRADVGTMALYGDGRNPGRFVPTRGTERVAGKARTLIQLRLVGGDFGVCRARTPAGRDQRTKPKEVRALWGKGKGRFRTRGRYASAAVRGTAWRTADRCDGTLTSVRQGVVAVTDFTRNRTVLVRAGKSYLAPAQR